MSVFLPAVQLLVFCKIDAYGNPTVPGLLSLAGQMKMGRGLLMAVGLLEGNMVEVSVPRPLCLGPVRRRCKRVDYFLQNEKTGVPIEWESYCSDER